MVLRPALALCAALACAGPALADPLDARAARGLLYPADRVEVLRHDMTGLSEQEASVLTSVVQTQKYYAAVAYAPDMGIMAEPTVMSANYHSPEAARAAALAGCNARRTGGRDCALALEVRPAGWEARGLSLSADATTDFETTYLAASGSRALAVSASSGQWGIGRGNAAAAEAVAACQTDTGVSDCAVVIAD
ncbi:MAG: 5-aminolevulic acid synthase [Pararhodobacter sp.]